MAGVETDPLPDLASGFQTLKLEPHDDVAAIFPARPQKRNALSSELSRELVQALATHADVAGIGAIVLTGEDPAFCAGMDLHEPSAAADLAGQRERLAVSAHHHHVLWNYPKPVVCAVNGPALGGGLDLSPLRDIRVASERATFGDPQIKFGVPTLFTPLRWLIGDGRARELCLTGRVVDAAEALRLGLVSRVVGHEQLLTHAIQLAADIAQAPAQTLAAVKGYMASAGSRDFEHSLRVEHDDAFAAMFAHAGEAQQGGVIAERAAQRLARLPPEGNSAPATQEVTWAHPR